MHKVAAFNTPEGKAVSVQTSTKKDSATGSLTQGHRHAIELYQVETALLASGPEFLKTINAPADRTGFCHCTSDNW